MTRIKITEDDIECTDSGEVFIKISGGLAGEEPLKQQILSDYQIVERLIKETKHFKELYNEYEEKGDQQSMQESHLIWYYLFGCLGKDAEQILEGDKK